MGAELNAGTDKESTTSTRACSTSTSPRAFDVMADMVWRPAFRDVDPEREVVLEEIAMYEDDPQDTVFDVLGDAVFGDHPLGRPIIGRAPVIRDTPRRRDRRLPRAPLRARAPSSSRRPARSTTTRWSRSPRRRSAGCGRARARPCREPAPPLPHARVRFQRKDTEQVHVCLGAPGLPRGDERRFALRVLDAIFGGLSSSRLFQAVREERGLAYAVYSFSGQSRDTGQVGLYVGTRPDNLAEAMQVVGRRARRACAPSRPPRRSWRAPRRTSRRASCSRWSPPRRA